MIMVGVAIMGDYNDVTEEFAHTHTHTHSHPWDDRDSILFSSADTE